MKSLGSILKGIGGFSLVMTGLHLWRVGFPRLEGPEGESWAKVLSILASNMSDVPNHDDQGKDENQLAYARSDFSVSAYWISSAGRRRTHKACSSLRKVQP